MWRQHETIDILPTQMHLLQGFIYHILSEILQMLRGHDT